MSRHPGTEERFWTRVVKTDNCWLWSGYTGGNGYAYITIEGQKIGAHRYSYEIHQGDIPTGYQIDHLCRTPKCVNPSHLEAVTPKENTLRGKSSRLRKQRTHCKRGHSLAEHGRERLKKGRDNPYTWCTLCNKIDCAAKYQARKDSATK